MRKLNPLVYKRAAKRLYDYLCCCPAIRNQFRSANWADDYISLLRRAYKSRCDSSFGVWSITFGLGWDGYQRRQQTLLELAMALETYNKENF